MGKNSLHLNWCSHKAAKYAVENWHYSKCIPKSKLIKIGVWEEGQFIGVIIFGVGANKFIGRPYSLKPTEVCELNRIALKNHDHPVTQILAIAIKKLKKYCPGLRLIVSYADGNQNHLGIIYQAGNWIYEGEFSKASHLLIKGDLIHRRTVNLRYGTSSIEWLRKKVDPKAKVIVGKSKYKYLMPLDKKMREQIQSFAKPYPKELK